MALKVGMVRTTCRLALAGMAVLAGYEAFVASGPFSTGLGAMGSGLGPAGHVLAFYAITLLAFAAFPKRRRSDIFKAVVLLGALVEIVRFVMGQGFLAPAILGQPLGAMSSSPANLLADIGGAYAVFLPSFMERFRALTRADPHEPLSMVYPGDRRRRSPRTSTSGSYGYAKT